MHGDHMAPYRDRVAPYSTAWPHMGTPGVVWAHKGMYEDSMALYRDSVASYSTAWPHTGMYRGGIASYRDAQELYDHI